MTRGNVAEAIANKMCLTSQRFNVEVISSVSFLYIHVEARFSRSDFYEVLIALMSVDYVHDLDHATCTQAGAHAAASAQPLSCSCRRCETFSTSRINMWNDKIRL